MELRLDDGPASIIGQLRATLLPEDFAALVAAFAREAAAIVERG
jgi:hypothetical protein